ncbi:HRDC domain-containing protein [Bacillus xiapuensis]|uniref:HRDC domain-containing protein n=1 Tax=Bacillus xiapuensis TaxID=2014075 RepID=UPI000C2438D1|nr:HRDC domain-containing protein [Bacillus xiapuensis]
MRDIGAVTRTPIKSVVVFSNIKTVINTKKTSEHVKKKILRVDGLVGYIKQELEKSSPVHFLDNRMVEMKLLEETISKQNESNELMVSVNTNNNDLEETLKRFRMKLATGQNVKAFHIFSNKPLEELILKQPCNLVVLKTIHGIGEMKINAFGEELIGFIKTSSNGKQDA